MQKEKNFRATSVYISAEDNSKLKRISVQAGSISHLFSGFVTRLFSMGHPFAIDRFAVILTSNVEPPLEAGSRLSLSHVYEEDQVYLFDKWLSSESTQGVFLMGTTMARPIVGYATFWRRFLQDGKNLAILLQGKLGEEGDKPIYTPVKEDLDKTFERRTQALEVLTELKKTAPAGTLNVKNSGEFLIPYSAVIVTRESRELRDWFEADIQIQPYNFLPLEDFNRGVRFLVTTNNRSSTYKILTDPIIELWLKAQTEVGFE